LADIGQRGNMVSVLFDTAPRHLCTSIMFWHPVGLLKLAWICNTLNQGFNLRLHYIRPFHEIRHQLGDGSSSAVHAAGL
jgi:hypothetical protein